LFLFFQTDTETVETMTTSPAEAGHVLLIVSGGHQLKLVADGTLFSSGHRRQSFIF